MRGGGNDVGTNSPCSFAGEISGKIAHVPTRNYSLLPGATSGIGHATAILFHRLGATLVVTGRNTERLKAIEAQLNDGKVRFMLPEFFLVR